MHRFGCGPLQAGEGAPTVRVFRHRLLQHFMLSLFCKLPVQPMTRIADMRAAFMVPVPASWLSSRFCPPCCLHALPTIPVSMRRRRRSPTEPQMCVIGAGPGGSVMQVSHAVAACDHTRLPGGAQRTGGVWHVDPAAR